MNVRYGCLWLVLLVALTPLWGRAEDAEKQRDRMICTGTWLWSKPNQLNRLFRFYADGTGQMAYEPCAGKSVVEEVTWSRNSCFLKVKDSEGEQIGTWSYWHPHCFRSGQSILRKAGP